MGYYYLDTSALMRRAEALCVGAIARSTKSAVELDGIVSDKANLVCLSEVTLVEFHTNICTYLRCQKPESRHYDDTWFDKAKLQVMLEIKEGQLRVLPLPPRAIELAMTYVESATREHGRRFKSWDAVHLAHACSWAQEVRSQVTVISTDGDFAGFLQVFPAFGPYVQLLDPSV